MVTSSGVSRPRLRLGCECARLGARARARRRVREVLGCSGNMLWPARASHRALYQHYQPRIIPRAERE